MKWIESIKNLKYILTSVDDLRDNMKELDALANTIAAKKDEFYNLKAQSIETDEEREKNQQQVKICTDELDTLYQDYDKLYHCVDYLMKKFIIEKKVDFMKDTFYCDRLITLTELTNVIANLGVKCKMYQQNQAVVVYFDADEDFPEDIIVVVGLEDIWLKIQASPLRCEIKNEEQRLAFLNDANIYNNQNRYFKSYVDEDGQVYLERQEFSDGIRSSAELSNKVGFAIGAAYNFFKERKEFYAKVIETNKMEKLESLGLPTENNKIEKQNSICLPIK